MQNTLCFYCGILLGNKNKTVDHIVPKVKGGTNNKENLVSSCFSCNSSKGTRDAFIYSLQVLINKRLPRGVKISLNNDLVITLKYSLTDCHILVDKMIYQTLFSVFKDTLDCKAQILCYRSVDALVKVKQ